MKRIKSIALGILAGIIGLSLFVSPAFAARKSDPDPSPSPRGIGILNFFAKSGRVVLKAGTVESTSVPNFTISTGGKTYTIQTDSNTKFRRKFWGKGDFSDLKAGDSVDIIGKFTDDAKTVILASLVRDLSVQKRHGVFFGTIDSFSSSGMTFVLKSVRRGDMHVTFDSSTKLINREGQAITLSDLVDGQRVRVRGLWDKTAGTLTEVTEVKDFALPIEPSPSAE